MAEWYYDEETGEYFEALPEGGGYEVVDSYTFEPEPEPTGFESNKDAGILDFATGVGANVASGISRGVGGIVRAGEELLDTGTTYGRDLLDEADLVGDYYRAQAGYEDMGLGGQVAFDALTSAGQFLPHVAAGGGSAVLPLIGMGLQHTGDTYDQYRDRGVPSATAAKGAPIAGLVNAGLESFGLSNLLNPAKSFAKKAVQQAVIEGSEELLQGVADMAIAEQVTGERTTPEEIYSLPYQALVGAVAGAGQTAAVHPFVRHQQKRVANRIEQLESNWDLDRAAQDTLADDGAGTPLLIDNSDFDVPETYLDETIPDDLREEVDIPAPREIPREEQGITPEDRAAMREALKSEVETWRNGDKISASLDEVFSETPAQEFFNDQDPIVQETAKDPVVREKLDKARSSVQILKGDSPETAEVVAGPAEQIDELEVKAAEQGKQTIRTVSSVSLGRDVTIATYTPIEKIAARPDLMQYRADADSSTGETDARKIREKFQVDKSGVVLVWEPKDPKKYGLEGNQKYIVVNGHNRYGAATRDEAPFLVTHVIREADGVTVEEARAYGAEINIGEGNTSIEDATRFFRDYAKKHGRAAAEERAKKIGIHKSSDRSKQARYSSTIAFGASSGTYSAYTSGRIDSDQAYTISKLIPNDENAQAEAMRFALRGVKGQSLENAIGAEKVSKEDLQQEIGGETVPPKVRKAARLQVVNEIQAQLRQQRAALGSARRPDAANATGLIEVKDAAAAQEKITELNAEIRRYNEWYNDSKARAEIDKRAEPIIEKMMAEGAAEVEQPSLFGQEPSVIRKMLDEEGGFFGLFGGKGVQQSYSPKGVEEVEGVILGNSKRIQRDAPQDFLEGNNKIAQYVPGAKGMQEYFRKALIYPRTVAEKFPVFRAFYDAARAKYAHRDMIGHRARETIEPFISLDDGSKEVVTAALFKAREDAKAGEDYPKTKQELLAKGLTEQEAEGFLAVRQTMDEAFETMAGTLLHTPPTSYYTTDENGNRIVDPQKFDQWATSVSEWMEKMKSEAFVPFSRFGKYDLWVPDAYDGKGYYALFEKKSQRDKAEKWWLDKGYDTILNEEGLLESPQEAYHKMSPDLGAQLQRFDFDGEMVKEIGGSFQQHGFPKHFKEAKLTPGYDMDLQRGLAEYIVSLSNWSSNRKAKHDFELAEQNIDPELNPKLWDYAKSYQKHILGYSKDAATFRQFMAGWYLTRPITALVNFTQGFTTTIPEMMNHMSVADAYAQGTSTAWMAKGFITDAEGTIAKIRKSDSDLADALQRAIADGAIQEEATRELGALAYGGNFNANRYMDKALSLFSAAEQYNRAHAFINGWKIARADGKSLAEAQRFGEEFVLKTQYDYTKANRPEAARGWKAVLFLFRNFQGSWIRQLRNNTEPGKRKAAIAMLAHMAALGGGAALPFFRELEKTLEAMGYDPKRIVRENFPDQMTADVLLYGLPTLFGLSISNNIAFQELAPMAERGVAGALGRFVLGVAVDPVQRIGRAGWLFSLDRDIEAWEQIMPPVARAISQSIRGGVQGELRDARGRPLVKAPGYWDLFLKALGGSPVALSRAYEQMHAKDVLVERARDNNNVNHRLAKARFEGDYRKVYAIKREILEHNRTHPPHMKITPHEPSIKKEMERLRLGKDSLLGIPKKALPEARRIQRVYSQ